MKLVNIVSFRLHFVNEHIVQEYQKLCQAVGRENVYIFFDDAKIAWDDTMCELFHIKKEQVFSAMNGVIDHGPAVLLINEESMKLQNPLHSGNRSSYDSSWGVFAKMLKRDFDYYWDIEYDVYCHGDWKRIFDRCNEIENDLLVPCIDHYGPHHGWNIYPHVWDRMQGLHIPKSELYTCLLMIGRLSKKMLGWIADNLGKMSGFVELYPINLCRHMHGNVQVFPMGVCGDYFTFYYIDESAKNVLRRPLDDMIYHPMKFEVGL